MVKRQCSAKCVLRNLFPDLIHKGNIDMEKNSQIYNRIMRQIDAKDLLTQSTAVQAPIGVLLGLLLPREGKRWRLHCT